MSTSDDDVLEYIIGKVGGCPLSLGRSLFDDATVDALARIRAQDEARYYRWRFRLKAVGADYMELRGLDTVTGRRARVIRKELRRAVA